MSDSASQGGAGRMLPDDWRELAPLVDLVLDAPPDERRRVVAELSRGDDRRRAQLERLVSECERDMPLIDRPVAERFASLFDASEATLPEVLVGRYRIEREIGRGGMARVYLAYDIKHARNVAVKVIRPDFAASLGRERFLREIGIAARLRHPNIVPLYDSGDADGVLFFVMPYEDGPSLRLRLKEGALPVGECVSVLRDVARALAYAHEQGVVHRDVKPDNVMMSGGAAVVTDFGIAKAVSVAQTGASGATLTQVGAGIGTPAYMAPEQAVGDPSTDHRADIYSFGCFAYELFTGNPPFHGMPAHQIISAHVGTKPTPLNEVSGAVPESIARIIAHCLEKQPDARPQSARELLGSLEEAVTLAPSAPSESVVRRRSRRYWWVGPAVAAGVIGTAVYVARRSPVVLPPITMAVLPFANISADSAMDFVTEGLADEVAAALQRVPGIQIRSRVGARAYRGQLSPDVADAGAKLKVDYLMTGVLRRERGRWLLSPSLERVKDLTTLWDTSFSVGQDQQTGAAEAIAQSLVAALRVKFPQTIGAAPALAANQKTSSNDAFALNMRGQEILTRRNQSAKEAANLFERAIHEDSLYARAYSGLSMALSLFPYLERTPAKEVHDRLVTAARRAIALDSTLAQPHVALGVSYWFSYEWEKAEAELKTALRLDPRSVEAHIQYARYFRFRGRNADAMAALRAARAEDPMSAVVLSHLSYSYFLNQEMDSALKESGRAMEMDPTNVTTLGYRAMILLRANQPEEALNLVVQKAKATSYGGYVIGRVDPAAARRRLKELDAETPQSYNAEQRRATFYLGLGDTASALTALERATDAGEHWHAGIGAFDPILDAVRNSPRFRVLMRRVRLAP